MEIKLETIHKICYSKIMKQTLVIGSTVADVIVKVPSIPSTGEDVNVISQHIQLGGCAYNVAHILSLTKTAHILCSPVGSGVYGDFVAAELKSLGIPCFVRLDIPNGCCYCVVENSGERSFMSYHGAEYIFYKKWMDSLDFSDIDSVYICGLEIEEPTGKEIVEFLEAHPDLTVFFAPGPRIHYLNKELLNRIFALHPFVHLNQQEVCSFTSISEPETASRRLHQLTNNNVVVTLGERGALVLEQGNTYTVPGFSTKVIDTIGAGDSHIGSIIAYLKQGFSLKDATFRANRLAAAVVATKGANLSKADYQKAWDCFI